MHPGAEVRLFINGQPRVCYPRVEAMGARELFRVYEVLTIADNALSRAFQGLRRVVGFA